MDKYEFNIKVEQIKKLVNKGDYETAMKIADTIDWRRVRSTSLLTMVAQVYERNSEYQAAKDILLLAFERAPIGKGLLFKLTDLALREGNVQEAEAYYREFCDQAGDDPRQFLLRYLILEAKEAPMDQQINTLERYCQEELDEKWLYHLAELYQRAGREEDCVQICDKIMLLFGLGKYVDKAMELKIQFAPLTKYQMDLVENREKYEEKLRAVEERYQKAPYRRELNEEEYFDSEDNEPDPEPSGEALEVSLHEARAEEELAKEMSKLEPYDEEKAAAGGETRVFSPARDMGYSQAPMGVGEDSEVPDYSGEVLAREEAAATAEPIRVQNGGFEEEEETIIEDWDLELEEEEKFHLMIEAELPENGLTLALEALKSLHRELGTKNPVAKISGEKLNRRGIFAVADRLAGKDLIIERAADLDHAIIDELTELMEQDKTGMVIVLLDVPARLQQMYDLYPAFSGKFRYITDQSVKSAQEEEFKIAREKELLRREAENEAEAARQRLTEREEEIRRQALHDAEARRRQNEYEPEGNSRTEYEAQDQLRRQTEYVAGEEERLQAEYEADEEARFRAEYEAKEAMGYQAGYEAGGENGYQSEYGADAEEFCRAEYEDNEETRRQAEYEAAEEARRQAEYEAVSAVRYQAEKEADEAIYQEEYREEFNRRREEGEDIRRRERYEEDDEEPEGYEDNYRTDEEGPDDGSEMDVEEFTQYACRYASEIDCSITGKSLLALYERVEMMEEDGVPLTKANAEDLIEEAADKAEKKSFGGLFSSKYDKEGLLILKEKHFFD